MQYKERAPYNRLPERAKCNLTWGRRPASHSPRERARRSQCQESGTAHRTVSGSFHCLHDKVSQMNILMLCSPCDAERKAAMQSFKGSWDGHRRGVSENQKHPTQAVISKPSFPLFLLWTIINFFFCLSQSRRSTQGYTQSGRRKRHFKRKIHLEHWGFTQSREEGQGKHFPRLPPSPLLPPNWLCFKPKPT